MKRFLFSNDAANPCVREDFLDTTAFGDLVYNIVEVITSQVQIKFRENLPNSPKFRGPTQSDRSRGSQR